MKFDKLTAYLESLPAVGIPGGSLCVYQKHTPIYQHSFGTGVGEQRATGEEHYFLYSCSKVLTCAAVMRLIEEGGLSLSTPVREVFPAYAHLAVEQDGVCRPAVGDMTVEHLLTMCGGFSYDRNHPTVRTYLAAHPGATARDLWRELAKMPLLFDPGTHFAYSFCHDTLLGILEEVSGQRASRYIREKMTEPLGISSLYYHTEEMPEGTPMATQYRVNADGVREVFPINEHILTPAYDSGGAGVITTAAEYIKFADAMAMGGVGANGARILSEESVKAMYQNRLGEVQMADYHRGVGNYGYGYGLGVRTLMSQNDHGNISLSHIGEFGWGGAAGAYILSDPQSGVSLVYTMHVLGWPFRGGYNDHPHNVIRDIVFEILG